MTQHGGKGGERPRIKENGMLPRKLERMLQAATSSARMGHQGSDPRPRRSGGDLGHVAVVSAVRLVKEDGHGHRLEERVQEGTGKLGLHVGLDAANVLAIFAEAVSEVITFVKATSNLGPSVLNDTTGADYHEDVEEHGNGTKARASLGRVAEHETCPKQAKDGEAVVDELAGNQCFNRTSRRVYGNQFLFDVLVCESRGKGEPRNSGQDGQEDGESGWRSLEGERVVWEEGDG